jgi:hypothetical protein
VDGADGAGNTLNRLLGRLLYSGCHRYPASIRRAASIVQALWSCLMDGFRFDHLTRLVGARLTRRTSFALLTAGAISHGASSGTSGKKKKSKKISVCYKGKTRKVKKQDWKKKYKGATKGPNCGAGCCADTFCFAEAVNPTDGQPTSFGCCPPDLTCTSQSSLPDQCCYPGESCRPDLAVTFGIEVETNCCRPCPAGGKDGCCIHAVDECIAGTCQPPGTARLPRKRRL